MAKYKVQAEVSAMAEKSIEAASLEDALAKAKNLSFNDFFYHGHSVQSWSGTRKVKIIGATEPKVTK